MAELERDDFEEPAPRRPKPRGTPAGSAIPRSDKPAKLVLGLGKVGEPLAPGEARRALYHSHQALVAALGSRVELRETDFDTQGDALADMSNHLFPQARLMLRAVSPLVFIGAELGVLREIIEGIDEDRGAKRLWTRIRKPKEKQPAPLYVVPQAPEQRAL